MPYTPLRFGTPLPEHVPTDYNKPVTFREKVTFVGASSSTVIEGGALVQESWTAPSLQNSWVDFGSGEQTTRYRKDSNGTVHVQGVIKNGTTTSNTLLFTLGVGYRPAGNLQIACASNNAYGQLKVLTNGQVLFRVGSATWFAFNFSFPT